MIDLIPSGQVFDIGGQLFPLLAEKGLPFYAQSRSFNWIDIGRVTDYWAVLPARAARRSGPDGHAGHARCARASGWA